MSGRLKILFITNWYPTKEDPAKAVWVREQAKAVQFYDDVRILHCVGPDQGLKGFWKTEPETDETLMEGIPVQRVWYRPSPILKSSYGAYVWSIIRAFRHIAKEGFRPNIINVHVYDAGGPALAISKLQGIPVVVSEHFSSFPRKLLGPLDICKAWLAFRWADAVLPVSHALQKAIEDYGIHARFRVIPNVADTSLFWPPSDRRRANPRCILFVGQLTPVKGVPDLLHALSRLGQRRDDWHVDIVGDGVARSEYERLAADLKLCEKVIFHGLRSRREVAEFMRRADLFVLPSLCETFSAPAVEALATGIPVLATRCGGPEEFITEEVGYLVARDDPDAFFNGLVYMLDHLHRYSSGRISQYAAERFSPQVVGGKLHALYEFLLAGRRLGSVSP